ncbi:hypothetical protein F5878DRAFT_309979 [Lentinula raphanica]|uniref:Uncharacterized protein n=1 Tax=Lentinula raphanica TaxID=153919 RepID=A0AA38PHT1_9AGAR|nr:hypothetical protein F5878DRAFT_309979 [Lentinula raphanica]
MTRLTASQMLSLLFLGAAISPNVLAAPTLSSISSSPGFSTGVRTVQPRPSSSEQGRQGSLSELQRREVDYSNLVPRGPVGNDGSMTSNQHAQHGKGDPSDPSRKTESYRSIDLEHTNWNQIEDQLLADEVALVKFGDSLVGKGSKERQQLKQDSKVMLQTILNNAEVVILGAHDPLYNLRTLERQALSNHNLCLSNHYLSYLEEKAAKDRMGGLLKHQGYR